MASKKTKKTATRPRQDRRAREREARKLVALREKLANLEVGGSPQHPLVVASAAVVEAKVAARGCPLCGGRVHIQGHDAIRAESRSIRAVIAKCTTCHAKRTTYVEIAPALAH